MDSKLTWQYGSEHPENSANLDAIRQWWSKLSGKTVLWQQRIVPDGEEVGQLDWEPQRFDERFAIAEPELKGITVYWRKPEEEAPPQHYRRNPRTGNSAAATVCLSQISP